MAFEDVRKQAKKAAFDHMNAAYKMWLFAHNIKTDLNAPQLLEAWENGAAIELPNNNCDCFLRAFCVAYGEIKR